MFVQKGFFDFHFTQTVFGKGKVKAVLALDTQFPFTHLSVRSCGDFENSIVLDLCADITSDTAICTHRVDQHTLLLDPDHRNFRFNMR